MEVDIRAVADALGYLAAALGILLESAGIPFPGEAMLLAVAAYAATGALDVRLVVGLGFAGTVVGADLGYAIGHFGGRPFVERMGGFLRVGPGHFARSELFFARYGGATILFARFLVGLRTWTSVMAGMSRMPFWTFQLYSAVGGLAWALAIGAAGFAIGSNWALVERLAGALGASGLAVAVAVIAAVLLLRGRGAHTWPPRRRYPPAGSPGRRSRG